MIKLQINHDIFELNNNKVRYFYETDCRADNLSKKDCYELMADIIIDRDYSFKQVGLLHAFLMSAYPL